MWKQSSILALSLVLVGFGSCSSPIPRWDGEIFAGSHKDGGIVRRQAGQVIKGDDPQIDEFMAMRWKGPNGFEGFYETYVLGCKEWKKGVPVMSLQEAAVQLEEAKEK